MLGYVDLNCIRWNAMSLMASPACNFRVVYLSNKNPPISWGDAASRSVKDQQTPYSLWRN